MKLQKALGLDLWFDIDFVDESCVMRVCDIVRSWSVLNTNAVLYDMLRVTSFPMVVVVH